VTSNVWSHSGLQNGVAAHNLIRFERDGEAIEQFETKCVESSMSYTSGGGAVSVHADLTNAYSNHASDILSWTRDLEFSGDVLRVHDSCTVAAGVHAIFQRCTFPACPSCSPTAPSRRAGFTSFRCSRSP
jgi:hypothetical protein